MSAGLYTVRIYHDGQRPGVVRINGLQRHITEPPQIHGLPQLDAIDFAPATATYLLRPRDDGERGMHDQEIASVHAWLDSVARGES